MPRERIDDVDDQEEWSNDDADKYFVFETEGYIQNG
jgi:hypothetical protein